MSTLNALALTMYSRPGVGLIPIFNLPLKSSFIPIKGILDSFTRTSAATVKEGVDNLTVVVLPEEVRFTGARREYNSAINGDLPSTQTITVISGNEYQIRIGETSANGSTAVCTGAFTGTLIGDATDAQGFNAAKTATTTTLTVTITGVVTDLMIVDVTGRSNQNPPEYVSSGRIMVDPEFNTDVGAGGQNADVNLNGTAVITGGQLDMPQFQNIQGLFNAKANTKYRIEFQQINGGLLVHNLGGVNLPYSGSYDEIITTVNDDKWTATAGFGAGSFLYFRVTEINENTNVGGVQCFSYKQNNTVSSNVIIEARGADIADATLKGYLGETERTNKLLQNRDFSTTWTQSFTVTLVQDQIGIDGVDNTAWTLGDNDAGEWANFSQAMTIANNSLPVAAHFYVLKDSDTTRFPEFQLLINGGGTVQSIITQLNTSTGVLDDRTLIGTGASEVEAITIAGRDWWKLSLYIQNNSTGNVQTEVKIYPAVTSVFGNISRSAIGEIVVDAPQIEEGFFQTTSSIFTTTAEVTRTVDTLSYDEPVYLTGANVNDFVVVCKVRKRNIIDSANCVIFDLSADSGSDRIVIWFSPTTDKFQISKITSAGSFTIAANDVAVNDTEYKIAALFSSTSGISMWIDGVKQTETDANTSDIDRETTPQKLFVGCKWDNTNQLNGNAGEMRIYRGDLTDAQIATL